MKKLSPGSRHAIDQLATLLLTIPPVDREAARQRIFLESYDDFRSKNPALPGHEAANATINFMKAIDTRITEMIAQGAGNEGHG
jgi:hypothetical protein